MLTLMTTFAVRTAGDSRFFAAEDDIYYTHTHTSTHIVLRFRFIGKYLRHRKKKSRDRRDERFGGQRNCLRVVAAVL